MASSCKSCGAPLHWALTPAGKKAPIDWAPDAEKGNVLLSPQAMASELLAVTLTGDALECARRGGHLFMNHWATCPDRAEWREQTDRERGGIDGERDSE